MEKLLAILQEIRPDVDFEKEKKLIDDSILDSFDIIAVVSELNDAYDISIEIEDLEHENFNSIEAMKDLIDHLSSKK